MAIIREEAGDYAQRSSLINVRSCYHVVNMIAQFLISTQRSAALFAWDYAAHARGATAALLSSFYRVIVISDHSPDQRLSTIGFPVVVIRCAVWLETSSASCITPLSTFISNSYPPQCEV